MNKRRSQKIVEMARHQRVNQPLCDQGNISVEHSDIESSDIELSDNLRGKNHDHTDKSTGVADGRTTINSKEHVKLADQENINVEHSDKDNLRGNDHYLTDASSGVADCGTMNNSKGYLKLRDHHRIFTNVDLRNDFENKTKDDEPALLLPDCADLAVPSYVLHSETITSRNDKFMLSSIDWKSFDSVAFTLEGRTLTSKGTISSNEAFEIKICEPSTSGVAADKSKSLRASNMTFQTVLNDLEINSSESDPFAGDDEDKDPDFQLSENTRNKNNIILDKNTSHDYQASDSESSPEQELQKKKSRKRTREPEVWRRNKIKRSRNSGKSYVNWKGNYVAERKVKDPCACRLKCTNKLSLENRINIFNGYWGLSDLNRQRDYISKYVICQNKARYRKREISESQAEDSLNDESSRKNFTFVYHLPLGEAKVKVCKTFFLNTLSISAQTVRTVFNKLGSSGVVSEYKRGKVCKNAMLDESVKQSIRDHINCFETVESHYCRSKTKRLFLPPTLNICKMYHLYEEYCEYNGIPRKATESMYRTIFNTEFNMSFFKPKKDLCDICHSYENSSTEEKLAMEEEYQLHLKNKDLARDLKKSDKERAKQTPTLCSVVFDLQQILSVPKSEVGLAYYKLKLSTYNFTVFNLASKDAFCYMWYECIGNRGSSEIGSCLLLFIEDHIQKGANEFAFYSDNCAGQNRNKFLFSLYNYCCQKYKIKIRHTFLEKGQTQSEGDSVHSVIEKTARNVPIYSPEQWYTLVRTCKRKQPYYVIELEQENIWNLKDLQEKTSINWEKNEQNEKVVWNKMKIVEANFEMPNIILYKYTYDEQDPFKKIIISKKGRKSLDVTVQDVQLKRLHPNLIPLCKKNITT